MTVEDFVDRARNQQWCEWILNLPPWERRFVFKHEMEWYYDWLNGHVDRETLQVIVGTHFDQILHRTP